MLAEYSFDYLKEMHESHPSIVLKDRASNQVVGYALATTFEIASKHNLLLELVNLLDKLEYKGKKLSNAKCIIVGQLCIAKAYRGKQLALELYRAFQSSLDSHYDYSVTEVRTDNARSLRLHEKAGYVVIYRYDYDGTSFEVVLSDWTTCISKSQPH